MSLSNAKVVLTPNPHYMSCQQEISPSFRTVVVDWMVDVASESQMLQDTLFLAVHIMDRYLSSTKIGLSRFQLVAVTCLFIAAKFNETRLFLCKDAAEFTGNTYTVKEICDTEIRILHRIGWAIAPSCSCFCSIVESFLEEIPEAEQQREFRKQMLLLYIGTLRDYDMLVFTPHEIIVTAAHVVFQSLFGKQFVEYHIQLNQNLVARLVRLLACYCKK